MRMLPSRFSAPRDVYLTGFCLFLSLVLTRSFYIILELIHTQEEYAKLKQQVRNLHGFFSLNHIPTLLYHFT